MDNTRQVPSNSEGLQLRYLQGSTDPPVAMEPTQDEVSSQQGRGDHGHHHQRSHHRSPQRDDREGGVDEERDLRYKRKKHRRHRSRKHLPPVRVGDFSIEDRGGAPSPRGQTEGYDNYAYERSSSSPGRIRQRKSSWEERGSKDVGQGHGQLERESDVARQRIVEEPVMVAKTSEVQGAGLEILKYTSEDNWHTDVEKFVKDKEIKQRTGPKVSDLKDADSFGEIEFIGFGQNNKTAPYIRVDQNTKPEILWELLTKHWKMPLPKVLISVTGGAKDFFFKGRLKNLFNKGLFKAAVSTGAWIITGGTAVGVMKKVGEAINEESQGMMDKHRHVTALGIATWNVISNRDVLVNLKNSGGLWPAEYREKDLIHKDAKYTSLDCNHTHFILVDHGKEDYGADIGLRASLEQYINTKAMANSDSEKSYVPLVLVVVEGGYGTIETVYESLVPKQTNGNVSPNSVPVVIVEGSGRAADIISDALRKTKPLMDHAEDIKKVLQSMDSLQNEIKDKDKLENCISWLQTIMKDQSYRDMITVFHMQEDNFKDIDRAILHGLLQAKSLSDNIQVQMNLALRWNRSDIARDEIITAERRNKWENAKFEENMMLALIGNKVEFVELFLQHVIHLDKFLTIRRLYELYKQVVFCKWSLDGRSSTKDIVKIRLDKLSDKDDRHLAHLLQNVGRMVHKLTLHEHEIMYSEEKYIVRPSVGQSTVDIEKNGECDLECPAQHLFLWAVLLNRRAMAKLFWKRLNVGNIGSALIAGRILKALSEHAKTEEELTLYYDLCDHANDFEDLAIGVLENCYESDKKMSKLALVRKLTAWGDTTCLAIAYAADQMKFMEHDCCQTKLQRVWKGNVQLHSFQQWLGFVVASFFPFIIPGMTFLSKDYKEIPLETEESDDSRGDQQEPEKEKPRPSAYQRVKNCIFRSQSDLSPEKGSEVRRIGGEEDDVTLWEGLGYYYKAPVTKFYYGVILYIILLILFSIFILTDLRPASEPNSPGIIEIIVICWVGTLLVEEFRQVFVKEPKSFWYKVWSWGSDAWNLFDLTMFSLFIVSIILRFTLPAEYFAAARVVYCITLMFFYFRLLHMGFVQKDIGPKIIMISKMLGDLGYFIAILVIFILSFGIANEALLYPNMNRNPLIIFKSIYKPYWQLYGELFLEETEGFVDNSTCYEDPRYMDTCPHPDDSIRWVPPTLTAIYMLISNILLINLLIAMFSYTFQKVQDNSETIWRFYRYELISEYNDRPALAPPFIIINHIYRLLRFCYFKMKLWSALRNAEQSENAEKEKSKILKEYDKNQSHTLQVRLDDRLEDYVNVFERKHMVNHFIKKNQDYVTSWQSTVTSTGEKMEQVIHEVEELKEYVGISSKPETPSGKTGPVAAAQTGVKGQGDGPAPSSTGLEDTVQVDAQRTDLDAQINNLSSRVLGLEAKIDRVLRLLEHPPVTQTQF